MFKNTSLLDLHSIRHIFNAAEPISVDVAMQFISTFAQFGLDRKAMTGGYGLAESCVYVCDGGHGVLRVERSAFECDEVKVLEWMDCVTGQVRGVPEKGVEKGDEKGDEKGVEKGVEREKKGVEMGDEMEKKGDEKEKKGDEKEKKGDEREKKGEEKTGPVSLFSCGDVTKNKDVVIRIVREGHDVGVLFFLWPQH